MEYHSVGKGNDEEVRSLVFNLACLFSVLCSLILRISILYDRYY